MIAAVPLLRSGDAVRRTIARYWREQRLSFVGACLTALIIVLAVIGPLFAPYDPNGLSLNATLEPPSSAHWMGTDQFGRDYFSRWMIGGRTSLLVAGGSVCFAFVLGNLFGLIAGFKHGSSVDHVFMRLTDAIIAIPTIVLVIAVAGTIGAQGLDLGFMHISQVGVLVVVLGIGFIPSFSRIARIATHAEMEEVYVSAARALGAGPNRIVFRNVLPNVLPPLVIQASFTLAVAIGAEAAISFLGFGIQTPTASWGNLLTGSRDFILNGNWWLVVFPSVAIIICVFAFNLLGDGLRDVLDPRQRSKVRPETE